MVDTDIILTAPAGMICCANLGGKLVPDTLYVTDENDTWTLVWNATLGQWLACGEHAGFSTHRWTLVMGSGVCSDETADVPYSLKITCAASGGSNFAVGWKTVQPCSGTDWTTAAADCDPDGTSPQPTFDADGAANPTHYQTAGGVGSSSIRPDGDPDQLHDRSSQLGRRRRRAQRCGGQRAGGRAVCGHGVSRLSRSPEVFAQIESEQSIP